MKRGTRLPSERTDRIDPFTGVTIRQMTNRDTDTIHMHYESTTISADNEWMITASTRADGGHDLYACRMDGCDLTRINEAPTSGVGFTPEGKHVLYFEGSDLRRMCLEDRTDEVISHLEWAEPGGSYRGVRSYDGKYHIAVVKVKDSDGLFRLIRWNLADGEVTVMAEHHHFGHLTANPGGPEISFIRYGKREGTIYRMHSSILHCETLEELPVSKVREELEPATAHSFWLGKTNLYQATSQWPVHSIIVINLQTGEKETVAEGPYFWHSGASYDGKWIIADTNFPDRGIWLVNVATKKSERLCYAMSSQGHAQSSHPHPNLSDDGQYAVFTSDRTGTAQVYVVEIPAEMQARLSGA